MSVLSRALAALSASGADARWSDDRTFHVTAAFLGETAADRLPALRAAMAAAQRALAGRLRDAAFPVEERPYLPHTTLGRLRTARGREALLAAARPWRSPAAWAGADFPCGPLKLLASRLTPDGPVHSELA